MGCLQTAKRMVCSTEFHKTGFPTVCPQTAMLKDSRMECPQTGSLTEYLLMAKPTGCLMGYPQMAMPTDSQTASRKEYLTGSMTECLMGSSMVCPPRENLMGSSTGMSMEIPKDSLLHTPLEML